MNNYITTKIEMLWKRINQKKLNNLLAVIYPNKLNRVG